MSENRLHVPDRANGWGLALTHGAGGNADVALLVAIADAFCGAGYTVLRFNLPFREKRSFGPPSPSGAAADREGIRAACARLRTLAPGKLILGGHSYGGRQASMLLAEDPTVADALMLLSYPLHPPEKPQQLRTAHLPQLRTNCLFVHGTKDPFGSVAEMESALRMITGQTKLHVVDRAGHDLARGKFDIGPLLNYFAATGLGGTSETASVI